MATARSGSDACSIAMPAWSTCRSWRRCKTVRHFLPPPVCSRSAARWRCCATNDALAVLSALPIDLSPSPALWEIKCLGLVLIFVYAFFKFAWAYRLFNYVAILLGAMPPAAQRDTPEAEAHVIRTTRLFEAAGRHFNRGQRAFFFALGDLGWFISPWVLFVTTALVVIVTWRRQFASNAWRAMRVKTSPRNPAA